MTNRDVVGLLRGGLTPSIVIAKIKASKCSFDTSPLALLARKARSVPNEVIRRQNLPESPAVRLNTSAECWCGAYQGREDFEALLSMHPEIFDKLLAVEKAQRGKYTFLFENGQRIPLIQLKVTPKSKPIHLSINPADQVSRTQAAPQLVD